jgi:acid phosphatase family membrane protein YuiD
VQRLPERIERLERTLRYLRTADAVVRGRVPRARTLVHLGDELLGDVVHARQTDTGAQVARAVTELGEWTTHTTVIASAALLPSRHTQRRRAAAQATLAMVGCSLAYTTVKTLVRRSRPHPSKHLVTVHDSSFPSGHTATAAAAAETLADLFGLPRTPLYALAAGVGFTRVYLGVHHPSDVLAGLVLGVAWARGASLLADVLPLPEDDPGVATTDGDPGRGADTVGDDDAGDTGDTVGADDGQLALTIAFTPRAAVVDVDVDDEPPAPLRRVSPPDGDHPSLY